MATSKFIELFGRLRPKRSGRGISFNQHPDISWKKVLHGKKRRLHRSYLISEGIYRKALKIIMASRETYVSERRSVIDEDMCSKVGPKIRWKTDFTCRKSGHSHSQLSTELVDLLTHKSDHTASRYSALGVEDFNECCLVYKTVWGEKKSGQTTPCADSSYPQSVWTPRVSQSKCSSSSWMQLDQHWFFSCFWLDEPNPSTNMCENERQRSWR